MIFFWYKGRSQHFLSSCANTKKCNFGILVLYKIFKAQQVSNLSFMSSSKITPPQCKQAKTNSSPPPYIESHLILQSYTLLTFLFFACGITRRNLFLGLVVPSAAIPSPATRGQPSQARETQSGNKQSPTFHHSYVL